jgi:arsenate reductase
MTTGPYTVLFMCTGNSARSILAEALLNHWGRGRFEGFSAGTHPTGRVHPIALELLRRAHLSTEGLRSKGWDEFAAPHAVPLDFVFSVCDKAAAERDRHWPGRPMRAHWEVPDPVAVRGTEAQSWGAFRSAFHLLERRIKLFTSLPFASLNRLRLQEHLIGIAALRQIESPAPSANLQL